VFPVQEYTTLPASAPTGSADPLIFNSWTPSVVRYAHVMAGEATSAVGEEFGVRRRS